MNGAANLTQRDGAVAGPVQSTQMLLNSRKVLFGLQQKAFDEFGVDFRLRPRRPLAGCHVRGGRQVGAGNGRLVLEPIQRYSHRCQRRLALLGDLLIEFALAIRDGLE